MGCSMQVRDPRSGEHVHDTDLVDVYRPIGEAVFDPLHRSLIQAHWVHHGDILEFQEDMSSRSYQLAKPGIQRLDPSNLQASLQ
jgi:hypothetical protein